MKQMGLWLWLGCCPVGSLAGVPEGLALAMRLAPRADAEQDTGARVREALADALGRAGCFAEAREMAMGITNYRRGLALGRVALHAAEAGDRGTAEALVADVGAAASAEGEWRRSRIEAYRAAVLASLGRFEEAKGILGGRLDPGDLVLGKTLVALALTRAGRFGEAEPMLRECQGGQMVAGAAWQADARLAMAGVVDGTGADGAARALRESAAEIAIASPHWIHPWELDRAGQILRGAMPLEPDVVRGWLEGAEAAGKAIHPALEERPRTLTRVALCWVATGQPDRAAAALRLAREAVDAIPPNERPTALAGIAIALERLGDAEGAARAWSEAFRAAAGHHNARIRARELAFVLIAHSGLRPDLGPDIRELVASAIATLEGDAAVAKAAG